LCDCYIELRQGMGERQAQLQALYRFACNCPACVRTGTGTAVGAGAVGTAGTVGTAADAGAAAAVRTAKEDDARRIRALRLERDQLTFVEMGELDRAIELGLELINLLQSPLSVGWGERYIAEACTTTAALLLELEGGSQRVKAADLLEKAHNWNMRLQGGRSVDSLASAAKLAKMKRDKR
jgi:hypothetical protein